MKMPFLVAAGLALILFDGWHADGGASVLPVRYPAVHRAKANALPVRRPLSRTRGVTTSTCTTSYGFVGVMNEGDVAGGVNSGILGGTGNEACDPDSGVGTGQNNAIGYMNGATASFIAGGVSNAIVGKDAFVGAGTENVNNGNSSFVGAGDANETIDDDSFVGAGDANEANGKYSFVGAGLDNTLVGSGSFIGAGGSIADTTPGNAVSASDSFMGAGDQNSIAANEAFDGAGTSNQILSGGTYGSIVAGAKNSVSASYGSVLSGYGNTASGTYAVVIGGNTSTAGGELSLAAGYHADAVYNGSFVWSDYRSGSPQVKDSSANQFVARASGGVSFYSNEAMTAGVKLAAGSGTWESLSDRNAKTGIVPLDDVSILAKVDALPVSMWSYRSERGVRHAGPMAQDFYAAFGVGEDDRHIASIDEDGVSLAAIKALHRENARLRASFDRAQKENDLMKSRLAALERRVDAIVLRAGPVAGTKRSNEIRS